MKKIPKEIVEKFELRNRLNEELNEWCDEEFEAEDYGYYVDHADITDFYAGERCDDNGYERHVVQCVGFCEDDFYGDIYYETEVDGKYLHFFFEC